MTALGFQIGWLAVRVTVMALVAAALTWWCARRAARSAVLVLAAGVMIFLALTVAAFCPMPELGRWSPFAHSATPSEALAAAEPLAAIAPDRDPPAEGPAFFGAWDLLKGIPGEATKSPAWQRGGAILAGLYGLGLAIAALRLFSGWLAVQALRRRSRPITDAGLLALTDTLRLAVGCKRRLELRECAEAGLAATVGWRRPVIFLPPEWPEWTLAERQAVLAHELAHITHADYFICVWTRLCQALYFYHPLMYWLSGQLRWQQELAADDLAASALLDRGQYLKALASLALRTPPRMSAGAMPWSAMTGGTLLRRIVMLRGTRNCRPLSKITRGLLVGVLAGLGLLLTTLGSPVTRAERPTEAAPPFEVGYLPADCQGFIGIRPSVFLKQPGMDKMGPLFNLLMMDSDVFFMFWPAALKAENIDEMVLNAHITSEGTGKPASRGFFWTSTLVRLNIDFDWPAYFRNISKQPDIMSIFARTIFGKADLADFELKEIREDGLTIYRLRISDKRMGSPRLVYFHMPDGRTLVTSGWFLPEREPRFEGFRQSIRNAPTARRRDWGTVYDKVARAPLAVVIDNHDGHYSKMFAHDLEASELGILENIRFAALGIELGERTHARLVLNAKSTQAAPELAKAVDALAGSWLDYVKREEAVVTNANTKGMTWFGNLLQSRQAHGEGARLEWLGHSSLRVRDILSFDPEQALNDILEKTESMND